MRGGGRYTRLDFFTCNNLQHILRNKVYIGVKTFKENGEQKEAKAVWKPIVDRQVFDAMQKILTLNKSRKKPHSHKRYPYLLTGITFCGKCGDHLSGKSAWGKSKKFPYYEHAWSTMKNSSLNEKIFDCKAPRRFSARKLEELVNHEVEKLITRTSIAKELLLEARKAHEANQGTQEVQRLKTQIYGFSSQLDGLAERLSQLPKSVSAAPIFKQMERIEDAKTKAQKRLEEVKKHNHISLPPIEIKSYTAFVDSLKGLIAGGDPEVKSKIIKRLIHRIEVLDKEVKIFYNVDENSLLREPMILGPHSLCPESGTVIELSDQKGKIAGGSEEPLDMTASSHFLHSSNFYAGGGSNSLTAGAERQISNKHPGANSYVSIFITHFLNLPAQNLKILRKLYTDLGLSSRQIEEITESQWPRDTVLAALRKHEIARHTTGSFAKKYGQKKVSGFLQDHRKEQKVIHEILSLRKSGNGFKKIASILNKQGISAPKGGKWCFQTVRRVIVRELKLKS